jgi:hypothetical protein
MRVFGLSFLKRDMWLPIGISVFRHPGNQRERTLVFASREIPVPKTPMRSVVERKRSGPLVFHVQGAAGECTVWDRSEPSDLSEKTRKLLDLSGDA